jgi:AcrR family transcriptional regulator
VGVRAICPSKSPVPSVRNPDRTRRLILDAALKEFAARGFAGARVDVIARRAAVNKRMLYHYFRDKNGLFKAVLRHKIAGRNAEVATKGPGLDVDANLPVWFRQNCEDADWVRLLAWESLQSVGEKVVDEPERQKVARRGLARIQEAQSDGRMRRDVSAKHIQLAKISLAMFPMALPQVARLVLGASPRDPKFHREYAEFLERIGDIFRPRPASR